MPPITTTIQVDRPADDVFAYATDPTRFREWQQGVVDGRMEAHGDGRSQRREARKEMPANLAALKRRLEDQR